MVAFKERTEILVADLVTLPNLIRGDLDALKTRKAEPCRT
jgi:hypothetical protein